MNLDKNQLVGLILIAIGLFDFVALPKIMENVWRKVKKPPPWSGGIDMLLRLTGVIFIFFGISYYFFGRLA
jgi:hypothetical protein